MSERKRSFPPVVNDQTRLLILGSLPGEVSLAKAQYYAYPQNQFWRLMGAVLDEPLPAMDYDSRLQTLLQHGVGLWDVVAEAERQGSLDSQIKQAVGNDLQALVANLPHLVTIGFNGNTSARLGTRQLSTQAATYRLIALPSSSPAHTQAFEQKLQRWQQLKASLSG
ncbi:uracil-DNA glycosylase family protein [Chitinimonas naiadis]